VSPLTRFVCVPAPSFHKLQDQPLLLFLAFSFLAAVGTLPTCMATSATTGGRLWQNGRLAQSYDRLGPCLGSGGMGSVWAARIGDGYSGETSGCAGSWVAVKAIPVELKPGERDAGGLHTGLRECLSTFKDLNPIHVVRYESYWLEEPAQLPFEIRQFCERGRSSSSAAPPPAAEAKLKPEHSASKAPALPPVPASPESDAAEDPSAALPSEVLDAEPAQSLRFIEPSEKAGFGLDSDRFGGASFGIGSFSLGCSSNNFGRNNSYSCGSPHGGESCGFLWEPNSDIVDGQTPRSTPVGSPQVRQRLPVIAAQQRPSEFVVLLIEMELMGPPPGGASATATEERSTLRAWLQRSSRSISDAADVFAALMLSVRHIHRKRIVHADLKPDNIFCVVERQKVAAVRIGDFGLAGENQLNRQFSYGVLKRPAALGGTPGYVAPEILRAERDLEVNPCSDKVDIYACAVILLELLLLPFRTHMEKARFMETCCDQKVMPDFIARLPKTKALLLEMLDHEPAARLSAEEVCKRFEKEVRKELCRSGMQLLCSPDFSERLPNQAGNGTVRQPDPVQKGRSGAESKVKGGAPPVPHRKHTGRKGRRRT